MKKLPKNWMWSWTSRGAKVFDDLPGRFVDTHRCQVLCFGHVIGPKKTSGALQVMVYAWKAASQDELSGILSNTTLVPNLCLTCLKNIKRKSHLPKRNHRRPGQSLQCKQPATLPQAILQAPLPSSSTNLEGTVMGRDGLSEDASMKTSFQIITK